MPTPADAPPRARRWPLARWILAALAVLVASTPFVVSRLLTPERLKGLVEAQVNGLIRGRLAVGHIALSFPLQIQAEALELYSPAGQRVVEVARLSGHCALAPLLSGAIRCSDIVADGALVTVARTASGAIDLADAVQPRTSSGPGGALPDLRLEPLTVQDLALRYRDASGLELGTRGATLSAVRLSLEGNAVVVSAELDAGALSLDSPSAVGSLRTERLHAPLRFRYDSIAGAGVLESPGLEATFPSRLSLEAQGRLTELGPGHLGRIDLEVKTRIDAEDERLTRFLSPALKAQLAMKGRLSAKARLSGALLSPDVSLSVDAAGLEIAGIALEHAALTASVSAARVSVSGLEITSGAGRISARAELALLPPQRWKVELEAERAPIAALLGPRFGKDLLPTEVSGRAELSGTSTSSALSLSADLELSDLPKRVPLALAGPFQVAARGRIAAGALSLGSLRIQGRSTSLSGRAFLGKNSLDAQVEVSTAELSRIVQGAVLAGPARASVHVFGPYSDVTAEGSAALTEVRRAGLPAAMSVDASFSFHQRSVELPRLSLSSTIGVVSARGRVHLGPPEAPSRVTLDLEILSATIDPSGPSGGRATGEVNVQGHLRGPLEALDGALTLSFARLEIMGLLTLSGRAPIKLERGTLSIARSPLVLAEGGVLQLSGQVGTTPAPSGGLPLALNVHIDDLQLGPLAALATKRLVVAGAASLDLSVGGTSQDPTVQLILDSRGLSIGDNASGDSGGMNPPAGATASLHASGPVIGGMNPPAGATASLHAFTKLRAGLKGPLGHLETEVSLVGEGGTVALSGTIDAKQQRLKLELLGRSIALPALIEEGRWASFTARLDVELAADGPWRAPSLVGKVRLSQGMLGEKPFGPPWVELELLPVAESGILAFRLRAGAEATASGRIGLAPLSLSATFEAKNFPVLVLVPERPAEVTVDVRLGAEGSVSYNASGLSVDARLSELEVSLEGSSFSLAAPASVSLHGGAAEVQGLRLLGPLGHLEIDGRYADTIRAEASGEMDAAVVTAFVPAFARADGRFGFSLSASGAAGAPQLQGKLEVLSPLSLRLRSGIREVVLDSGRILADGTQIRIDALTGRIGGGSFTAQGSVALEDFRIRSLDLGVHASQFPFRSGDFSAEANADLRLSGPLDAPRLSGELELIRARYFRKMKLDNFSFVSEAEESSGPDLGALADVELNLKVRSLGDLSLDVDAGSVSAHLGMNVALGVGGTLGGPTLEGRVYAEEGNLRFPAAKLDLVRADVDFDPLAEGGQGILVNLRAEGEVEAGSSLDPGGRARFVAVSLEGPLSALNLDLASDGLDRLQVLALLITGRAALADFSGNNPAIEGALGFAGTQLASPITAFIEDQLEQKLNLDLKLGAEVSSTGFRVTAQKEFTRRLMVEGSYRRGFDEAAEVTTTVRAVLSLFDRAFLEASTTATRKSSTNGATDPVTSGRIELKYQVLGR